MSETLKQYIKELNRKYVTGLAGEHAHRAALQDLIELSLGKGVEAVNDGKRIAQGQPDFQVLVHGIPVGVLEAKDIGTKLDREEKSKQMKGYNTLGNVILTDYLEFRWYRTGAKPQTIRIGEIRNGKIQPIEEQFPALIIMLNSFKTNRNSHTIQNAKDLAEHMANLAQLINKYIVSDLKSTNPSKPLPQQLEAFKKTIMPLMTVEQFADMYAQTIAYGLFVARVNYKGNEFTRSDAGKHIPYTNPFLRRLFRNIDDDVTEQAQKLATFDIGESVNWVADLLGDLLAHTDIEKVLRDFGKDEDRDDPVIHFYETFLNKYNPKLKDELGVYYTPKSVVNYIVRSIDSILQQEFTSSLNDSRTLILDPATGTGTFLFHVIEHIAKSVKDQMSGMWLSYVPTLLSRLFGFEILMAPYSVAHMRLGQQLRDLGYEFPTSDRLGIYLTNSLDEGKKRTEEMFEQFIADEVNDATEIKRNKKIMVVLGNPPYSNFGGLNKGAWITDLMKDWKPSGEKKWNPDDYMKFIRFGQWRINETGKGVLAFIVNRSFIQGLTHRRMRESLMQTFTDIYILDLHGDLSEHIPPEADANGNVFNIRQGVAIAFFVKNPDKKGVAKIHYAERWGSETEKFDWLDEHNISTTNWKILTDVDRDTCLGNFYFYSPKVFDDIEAYCEGWAINEVFPKYVSGVQTKKDELFVGYTVEEVKEKIEILLNPEKRSKSDELQNIIGESTWILKKAKAAKFDATKIEPFMVSSLDTRYIYYDKNLLGRARYSVLQNMLMPNIGIAFMRQSTTEQYNHFLATSCLVTDRLFYSKHGAPFYAPLYSYPERRNKELFQLEDDGSAWRISSKGRKPNLNPAFVIQMESKLGLKFISESVDNSELDDKVFYPEDVFHYAYAIFHSPKYRERYSSFLKIAFPRLPLTSDVRLFRQLSEKGAELVRWHLLTDRKTSPVNFSGDGKDVSIQKRDYSEKTGCVYINETKHFTNIPKEVWEFQIGGYQVLDQWLKVRQLDGHDLTIDDVGNYRYMVKAIMETLRLMKEIDELMPSFPLA